MGGDRGLAEAVGVGCTPLRGMDGMGWDDRSLPYGRVFRALNCATLPFNPDRQWINFEFGIAACRIRCTLAGGESARMGTAQNSA
ncbi:MAG: hypothetical protein RLZZ511_1063 [Cyanobacteriota bacterium]|jgi:hypothetical protein